MSVQALQALPPRREKRQQLSDEVATYVRELIVSGAVRTGDFLRLEPIAEAVGVSNTPVREGLRALASEGFVRLVPRRGFVVEAFTAQDVRDLFWAQAQLAGELAARAATRIEDNELAELERLVETYEAAIAAGDDDALPGLGHAFHRAVNLAAKSQRLALLLGTLVKHLPNRFYATIEGQVEGTRENHPRLLEALRKHDAEEARAIMTTHILEGGDNLIASLEADGLWRNGKHASE